MIPVTALPADFEALEAGGGLLIGESSLMAAMIERGLNDSTVWQRLLSAAPSGAGRGNTARIELPEGRRLVLKKLLRGGIAGRLRRELFTGTSRLLANILTPLEAAKRGIPTPAPAALLMVPGPPGFYHAWLALEEIVGASDLAAILDSGSSLSAAEASAVMKMIRDMHDRGLDHRDLNLGNVLLRSTAAGGCEAFIIDLDRGRLASGELSFLPRLAALFRLERSYIKRIESTGARVAKGELDRWYELYAADDRRLAARLTRWRWLMAPVLFAHRVGWSFSRQL